jgi:hypothetical protein
MRRSSKRGAMNLPEFEATPCVLDQQRCLLFRVFLRNHRKSIG